MEKTISVQIDDKLVNRIKKVFGEDVDLDKVVKDAIIYELNSIKLFKSANSEDEVVEVQPTVAHELVVSNEQPNTKGGPGVFKTNTGESIPTNQLENDMKSVDPEVLAKLEVMRKSAEVRQQAVMARKKMGRMNPMVNKSS